MVPFLLLPKEMAHSKMRQKSNFDTLHNKQISEHAEKKNSSDNQHYVRSILYRVVYEKTSEGVIEK